MPTFKDIALYGTIGVLTGASIALGMGTTVCSGAEAVSRFTAIDPELAQFCAHRSTQLEVASMAVSAISPIVSATAFFCRSDAFIRRVARYMGASAAALPMSLVYQSLSPGSVFKKFPISIYDACKISIGLVSACANSIMETAADEQTVNDPDEN